MTCLCWSGFSTNRWRLRARAALVERQMSELTRELETTRALAVERPRIPYRGELEGLDARARAIGLKVRALDRERDATRWALSQLLRRRLERWAIVAVGAGIACVAVAALISSPAPRRHWTPGGYGFHARPVVIVEASTHVSIGVGVVAGPETSAAMGVRNPSRTTNPR